MHLAAPQKTLSLLTPTQKSPKTAAPEGSTGHPCQCSFFQMGTGTKCKVKCSMEAATALTPTLHPPSWGSLLCGPLGSRRVPHSGNKA